MLRLQEGERLHAFNDRAPTDGAAASALLLQCVTSPRLTERLELEVSSFKVCEAELARGQIA